METKKYVRIKKASDSEFWYADKIGEIFRVVEVDDFSYRVDFPGPDVHLPVSREDGEVIVTEKRKAAVGERILITRALASLGSYKTGDIFKVREVEHRAVTVEEVSHFIVDSEYEVIVNSEVENEEADEMENLNQTVINNANTVFEKKDDKYFGYKSRFGDIVIGGAYSYRFVVHYAKTNQDVVIVPGDVNTVTTPVCTTLEERLWKPGAQAKACRDEIVEQAKADVEELANKYGYYYANGRNTKAEFIVNCEKRTVVTILRWIADGQIVAKGIAKAAPSDCFNVHIGKAIALRRALGLAVPDEYLNSPQPTEVRVGDVISWTAFKDEVYAVTKKSGIIYDFTRIKSGVKYNGLSYKNLLDSATIIDDSREEVVD